MRVQGRDGTRTGRRGSAAGSCRRLAVTAAAAVTGVLALGLAACTGSAPAAHGKRHDSSAQITISPATGSKRANPDQGVLVSVASGTIEHVTVSRGADPISGSFNTLRTAWRSAWPLLPAQTYTVTATAVNAEHRRITAASTFRTLQPQQTFHASTTLGWHQVYGVGMPIMITFSHPVLPRYRAAVERSIQITSSKPVVGAWYWDDTVAPSGTSLVFRTRTYWPQDTQVSMDAHLAGLQIAPGVYGSADLLQSFSIGKSLIAVVDTAGHHVHIYYQNKLFAVWPVSTGKPGDDTANGTYLTMDKENPSYMSGPGYTDFAVPFAVRFTASGNYMHDAYWSVAEQGYTNVSDGCVNIAPQNSETYYNLAVVGDPVTVINSPTAGGWDDGYTEWFLTWDQLLKGSATHLAVQAGPTGSGFITPSSLPPSLAKAPLNNSVPGNAAAS